MLLMDTNRYEKGKIYKIVDVGYNTCYIGSTCETLSQRMTRHRHYYQKFVETEQLKTYSSLVFDKHGILNCKIELIENYPCQNKEELLKQEGLHIRNNDCVNKNVAGRTNKEWCADNENKLKEHRKQYNEDNKNILIQKRKEKRQKDIEETRKKELDVYYKYRDKILKKMNTKIVCECGEEMCKSSLTRHLKRTKHQQRMREKELQNQDTENNN